MLISVKLQVWHTNLSCYIYLTDTLKLIIHLSCYNLYIYPLLKYFRRYNYYTLCADFQIIQIYHRTITKLIIYSPHQRISNKRQNLYRPTYRRHTNHTRYAASKKKLCEPEIWTWKQSNVEKILHNLANKKFNLDPESLATLRKPMSQSGVGEVSPGDINKRNRSRCDPSNYSPRSCRISEHLKKQTHIGTEEYLVKPILYRDMPISLLVTSS
jgi:hypothetical protein